MRYAHLSASHRAKAVNQLDDIFRFSTSPGRPRLGTAYSGTRYNCFILKVPLTGLEPVVSALRGRRVNHLHYSGIYIVGRRKNPPDYW